MVEQMLSMTESILVRTEQNKQTLKDLPKITESLKLENMTALLDLKPPPTVPRSE